MRRVVLAGFLQFSKIARTRAHTEQIFQCLFLEYQPHLKPASGLTSIKKDHQTNAALADGCSRKCSCQARDYGLGPAPAQADCASHG